VAAHADQVLHRIIRDPERNFEELWRTFHDRYPFFALRGVDWNRQYDTYRPTVTTKTSDDELFALLCRILEPLNDGHVSLTVPASGEQKARSFSSEKRPRFWQVFSNRQIEALFKTTGKTLVANGFGPPAETEAWMLHYCRSRSFGYLRIFELEGVERSALAAALDTIALDFKELEGVIIDIRDCPGGDDSAAITIVNRFCDRKRVAFHRRTKIGPGDSDLSPLRTWYMEPQGSAQFSGPIVLLTCDSVFSGGEIFALAVKQRPYVTIIGDHTNGIFSYELEKRLPNGWHYCLSYQIYLSADMVCYEGKGIPVDIELFNTVADIDAGVDPLITRALEVLGSLKRGRVHALEG
jgi:Peptidase family S41/Tricorn protease C1 domain